MSRQFTEKANKRLFSFRECRRVNLPTEVGITCYKTKIRPLLKYGATMWGGIPQYLLDQSENIQARGMPILGLHKDSLSPLKERRDTLTI